MSRTDLDPVTIARSLRRMAGNGSIEWVMEPMQASVLLDVADMLDENAKLREELEKWNRLAENIELPEYPVTEFHPKDLERENAKLREMSSALRQCLEWESCKGCPMQDKAGWCTRDNRLRELGIETGDGVS